MEPIRYFDSVEFIEPRCRNCKQVINYTQNTVFDAKKQVLNCSFCGSPV